MGHAQVVLWDLIVKWFPAVLLAALMLLLGLRILSFLRMAMDRVADSDRLRSYEYEGRDGEPVSIARLVVATVHGLFVFALIWLTAETLGIDVLSSAVASVARLIPAVVAAAATVVLAVVVGRFLGRLLGPIARHLGTDWLPGAVTVAFAILGVLAGLDVLGFGDVNVPLLELALVAVALIAVISYGVGGIAPARRWWEQRGRAKSSTVESVGAEGVTREEV